MARGYRNKLKKSDDLSDIIPSFKNAQQASTGEIFVNRANEKVSFKKGIGNIVVLENETTPTPTPTTTPEASLAITGFRLVGCIDQDIMLEDNKNYEFQGPLEMCVGKTLTVPENTTLTIL